MTPVPPKPDGNPYAVTPNGTPILERDDRLEWIDDWTNALAVTLDDNFRPHDDTGALITPGSIGAANQVHTHPELGSGGAWTIGNPNWRSATGTSAIGNGTSQTRFKRRGSSVDMVIYWAPGSTTAMGGSYFMWDPPVPFLDTNFLVGTLAYSLTGGSSTMYSGFMRAAGSVFVGQTNDTGLLGGHMAFVPGGWVKFSATYEVAPL